jgi:hypothetical protein
MVAKACLCTKVCTGPALCVPGNSAGCQHCKGISQWVSEVWLSVSLRESLTRLVIIMESLFRFNQTSRSTVTPCAALAVTHVMISCTCASCGHTWIPTCTWAIFCRELTSMQSSFLGTLKTALHISPDDRVHPKFLQTGAATGRLACTEPNMQGMPSRGRLCRVWVKCDDSRHPHMSAHTYTQHQGYTTHMRHVACCCVACTWVLLHIATLSLNL